MSLFFARQHRETLQALRERAGAPTAQPSADLLHDNQVLYQESLRRLCIDSSACVIITDHIVAKGREQAEENELGQVVPITRGGLEYFVDVMLELSLRVGGFGTRRVGMVIKSHSTHFPIGLELEELTLGMLLERLEEVSTPTQGEVPAFLELQDIPAFG